LDYTHEGFLISKIKLKKTCGKKKNIFFFNFREYKFYLSFENSVCEDYVTEKFWKVLDYSIIPVVLGGANYSKFAPTKSYINARDFGTIGLGFSKKIYRQIVVQAALVIRGLFICEFTYSRLVNVHQTSGFADFKCYSLAYMQFETNIYEKIQLIQKNIENFQYISKK
jgi:hypothetical protein